MNQFKIDKISLDWLDYLLLYLIYNYVLLAPYSKVEESFNLQAIHDIVFYGLDISKYDHLEFPGVVPRTFVGALIIALPVKLLNHLFQFSSKFDLQIISRTILGVVNTFSFIYLRHSVKVLFGKSASRWFMLFLLGQFHIIFYSSRTLPNMFALPLVVYSLSLVLQQRYKLSLIILSFTSIIFRIELILLTGILSLTLLITKIQSFSTIVRSGFLGVGFGALISLSIDSYFWQQYPKIPEIDGFIFNAIQGKSSLWGEDPYWSYFTNYIPNLSNNPLILLIAPIGLLFSDEITNKPSQFKKINIKGNFPKSIRQSNPITPLRILTITSLLYVLIYSIQPHKEWRFIIYIMPVITVLAANGTSIIFKRRSKTILFYLIPLIIFLSTFVSFGASLTKVLISSLNYPGGVALNEFHQIYKQTNISDLAPPLNTLTIHLDVPVCMTGASRFGQLWDNINYLNSTSSNTTYPLVIYDKTENISTLSQISSTFDYYVTADNINKTTIPIESGFQWETINITPAYSGFNRTFINTYISLFKSDPKSTILDISTSTINTFKSDKKQIIPLVKNLWNQLILTSDSVYIYKKVPFN